MARRRFQMPSVERRGRRKKYWQVRYRVDVLVGKGRVDRKQKTKFLGYCPTTTDPLRRRGRGEITKREAERLRNKLMEKVNSTTQVVQSQIPVADFVGIWAGKHVSELGAAVRSKYLSQMRHHFLPAFGEMRLCDLDTEMIQDWLNRKGLSYWSKASLRGMVSSIFTKASDWGYWHERNPVERVTPGKKRDSRPRKILDPVDAERFLVELPDFLQLIIRFIRATGCRISEVLGLQWKHVDLRNGWVRIEQRWYRGDIDVLKSERGARELPIGDLVETLREMTPGNPEGFVFAVHGEPWDDRTLMRNYMRPIARRLGLYFPGFGFHTFRREVATRIQEAGASTGETQLILGHSTADMTMRYTLPQRRRLEEIVARLQRQAKADVIPFPEQKANQDHE